MVDVKIFISDIHTYTHYNVIKENKDNLDKKIAKEKKIQKATIDIKKKYGKNAIIKGVNLVDGATTIDRNNQIGGHKA